VPASLAEACRSLVLWCSETRAIFDRYDIVSECDRHDAVLKLEARQTTIGHKTGTIQPETAENRIALLGPTGELN
jgi:hypothetical protein